MGISCWKLVEIFPARWRVKSLPEKGHKSSNLKWQDKAILLVLIYLMLFLHHAMPAKPVLLLIEKMHKIERTIDNCCYWLMLSLIIDHPMPSTVMIFYNIF